MGCLYLIYKLKEADMKNVRNYVIIPCALILLIILTSTCTIIIGPSSQKSITAFSIERCPGVISSSTITQLGPPPDATNLIATFKTTGVKVRIGAVEQVSGITANNFTSPKVYTVEAEDGSTKDYIVTVIVGSYNWLYYDDGVNNASVGNGAGSYYEVSVRFPTSMMTPFIGGYIIRMDEYIGDAPISMALNIYDEGTSDSAGSLIYSQSVVPNTSSWNNIDLSSPVEVTGTDIWAGYSVTHDVNKYPCGVDNGPHVSDGRWRRGSTTGAWGESTLDVNWNIRVLVLSP
jgi:hypothetical protein